MGTVWGWDGDGETVKNATSTVRPNICEQRNILCMCFFGMDIWYGIRV